LRSQLTNLHLCAVDACSDDLVVSLFFLIRGGVLSHLELSRTGTSLQLLSLLFQALDPESPAVLRDSPNTTLTKVFEDARAAMTGKRPTPRVDFGGGNVPSTPDGSTTLTLPGTNAGDTAPKSVVRLHTLDLTDLFLVDGPTSPHSPKSLASQTRSDSEISIGAAGLGNHPTLDTSTTSLSSNVTPLPAAANSISPGQAPLPDHWDALFKHFLNNTSLKHANFENSDVPSSLQRKIFSQCILRNLYFEHHEISEEEYLQEVRTNQVEQDGVDIGIRIQSPGSEGKSNTARGVG
jgi:hypothetical protein